jgi:hypothetical protein
VSLLADCETLVEVNSKLEPKDIALLRDCTTSIWRRFSRFAQNDWHGRLWLDFDLSGLSCRPLAEESQKGYFGENKTLLAAS